METANQQSAAQDQVEATLLRFVAENVAIDGGGLRPDEKLIESGRIDSLGLVNILSFIDATYGVDLMAVGDPRDFESVAAFAAAVRREQGPQQTQATQAVQR